MSQNLVNEENISLLGRLQKQRAMLGPLLIIAAWSFLGLAQEQAFVDIVCPLLPVAVQANCNLGCSSSLVLCNGGTIEAL